MTLLNEKENAAALEFARSHYQDHCHKRNQYEAVEIVAEQSGVGFTITVRCPWCRQKKNVTDYDVW